jgi:hypothetical protein
MIRTLDLLFTDIITWTLGYITFAMATRPHQAQADLLPCTSDSLLKDETKKGSKTKLDELQM